MKKIFKAILLLVAVYIWMQITMNVAINNWLTNAKSEEIHIIKSKEIVIPSEMWEVHKYISENPSVAYDINDTYIYLHWTWDNWTWRFTEGMMDNAWFRFTIAGVYQRKSFVNSIDYRSKQLWIDKDLVMWCVLWEQLRISTKWARGNLKAIVNWMTPRLLRSYNTSLGIGGIKLTTANQIKKDAIKYGYLDLRNDVITSSWLADNDAFNAKYATFLVYNIINRRAKEWVDISNNPGVVCTLYNMWNDPKKEPHQNPLIGWAVIRVWNKNFVYGWLAQWAYRYLKIYSDKK